MSGDADILRRAAVLVRERGRMATRGPWEWRTFDCPAVPGGPHHVCCEGVDALVHDPAPELAHEYNVIKVSHSDWAPSSGDQAWIALAGPPLAEPLAAWLEDAATTVALPHVGSTERPVMRANPNALAVARALLGEEAA